jgi:hypothetical protein
MQDARKKKKKKRLGLELEKKGKRRGCALACAAPPQKMQPSPFVKIKDNLFI